MSLLTHDKHPVATLPAGWEVIPGDGLACGQPVNREFSVVQETDVKKQESSDMTEVVLNIVKAGAQAIADSMRNTPGYRRARQEAISAYSAFYNESIKKIDEIEPKATDKFSLDEDHRSIKIAYRGREATFKRDGHRLTLKVGKSPAVDVPSTSNIPLVVQEVFAALLGIKS